LAGTGPTSLSVQPDDENDLLRRYEDGAPCSYNSACAQVTVTVNAKSADPASASATVNPIWHGGSTVLNANGGGGGTGETIALVHGSCGGTLAGTGNSLSVSPTTATTYYGAFMRTAPVQLQLHLRPGHGDGDREVG